MRNGRSSNMGTNASGFGATRPVNRRPDQYDRMGNQRTSAPPSRNGSPSYPSIKVRDNPDEIARSGCLPHKPGASERVSKTGNGPSWATCGPAGSRPPRRYQGPNGGAF